MGALDARSRRAARAPPARRLPLAALGPGPEQACAARRVRGQDRRQARAHRRQPERIVNAPITSVTVLEDRAAVSRRGKATLAAGQHRLVVERVAPVLADKTLTATAAGARVLDVRCERYLAPWRAPAVAIASLGSAGARSAPGGSAESIAGGPA